MVQEDSAGDQSHLDTAAARTFWETGCEASHCSDTMLPHAGRSVTVISVCMHAPFR